MFERARHLVSRVIRNKLAVLVDGRGLSRAVLRRSRTPNPFDTLFLSQIISDEVELDLAEISKPAVQGGDFWSLLWAMAGTRQAPILKKATYRVGTRHFSMILDLNEAPECGYLFRNPTPLLTNLIMRGGAVFLDIGANVGFHALTAGLHFKSVYAFEPTPDTFAALSRNVQLSRAENVQAVNVALSDREGTAALSRNPRNRGANRLSKRKLLPRDCTVAVQTLDNWAEKQACGSVTFMKLDVEGHEPSVLTGARRTLSRDHPAIFAEVSSIEAARKIVHQLPSEYVAYDPSSLRPLTRGSFNEMTRYRDVLFLSPKSQFEL